MSERRGRNPVTTGILVAGVGLVAAFGLGYLLMWIGSNRMEAAKRTERPYQVLLSHLAQTGVEAVGKAEASVAVKDWGQAQQSLDAAGQIVTVMERATSDGTAPRIREVRTALSDAQSAVGKQEEDAPNKTGELKRKLEALVEPTG